MLPSTRLFAPDRTEITDLDSWLRHAAPEGGEAQWRDGASAKEQARAWLRPGHPAVPEELWSAIEPLAPSGADEVYARPEHPTELDGFGGPRRHDTFACVRRDRETVLVVGVEAKAREDFDGTVGDRAGAEPPSQEQARCNLMARALFGRPVLDEQSGEILDRGLARHGYQLWTAAVGTVIEAQARGVERVALVVHQFVPADLATAEPEEVRGWQAALAANDERFAEFAAALEAAGSTTHETDYVQAGTALQVVKVETPI